MVITTRLSSSIRLFHSGPSQLSHLALVPDLSPLQDEESARSSTNSFT